MDDLNLNDEFTNEGDLPPQGQGGVTPPPAAQPKPQKSRNIFLAVGAILIAAVFFFIGWFARYYAIDSRARTLLWLIDTVDSNYYKEIDSGEWDEIYAELYDRVLPDRFCSYFTPEEYQELIRESEGSNADTGLAAIDDKETGALRVFHVIGNSPAAHAGIEAGMTVYRFGGSEDALQTGDRNALYSLSGKTGGKLVLECGFSEENKKVYALQSGEYLASYCSYRDSDTSYDFLGQEELVLTDTGNALEGLDDKTAYIRLTQFDGNADKEFEEMLVLMKERKREHLVLDLRSNGGGYLSTFQSIASHLLRNAEGNKPLVATAKFRNATRKYYAEGNDFSAYFSANSHVSILADENTASASECLIGALVDYGTVDFSDIYLRKSAEGVARSYGKGVMQSAFVATSGSMLRLTTAEINWPKGKSIHGVGVTEKDGAVGIPAPLLPNETDTMLAAVVAQISS